MDWFTLFTVSQVQSRASKVIFLGWAALAQSWAQQTGMWHQFVLEIILCTTKS